MTVTGENASSENDNVTEQVCTCGLRENLINCVFVSLTCLSLLISDVLRRFVASVTLE